MYVHIPFCESKCKYCGFYSEPIHNYDPDQLINAIIKELNNKIISKSQFQTIYIGGGSPSCLRRMAINEAHQGNRSKMPQIC